LGLNGILGSHIVEGGYDAPQFMIGFKEEVLEHLNEFPGPQSVLVLDNCPGLHNQLEMIYLVRARGARIEWLEPYDPEHNPIELAFRTAKQTLRRERELIGYMPRRERLRMALAKVGKKAARSHFRECGYVVP
jgi:transposase